jgi:hypothetical protein
MSNDAHRVTVAQLGEFISQLGIDWTPDDLRSIEVLPGKVVVTRYRRDENGLHVADYENNELTTETVTIAVVAK